MKPIISHDFICLQLKIIVQLSGIILCEAMAELEKKDLLK